MHSSATTAAPRGTPANRRAPRSEPYSIVIPPPNVTAALHWLNSIPNTLICEFVAEEETRLAERTDALIEILETFPRDAVEDGTLPRMRPSPESG